MKETGWITIDKLLVDFNKEKILKKNEIPQNIKLFYIHRSLALG